MRRRRNQSCKDSPPRSRQRVGTNVLRFSVVHCVEGVDEVGTDDAEDTRVHCFVASVAIEDLSRPEGFQLALVVAEDYDLSDSAQCCELDSESAAVTASTDDQEGRIGVSRMSLRRRSMALGCPDRTLCRTGRWR